MQDELEGTVAKVIEGVVHERHFEPPTALAAAWRRALSVNALSLQRDLAVEFAERVEGRLGTLWLSEREFEVLVALGATGRATPRRLARQCGLPWPVLQSLLQELEDKRAVTCQRLGPHTHILLTVFGQSLLSTALSEREQVLADCYASLSEEELYALLALLNKVMNARG